MPALFSAGAGDLSHRGPDLHAGGQCQWQCHDYHDALRTMGGRPMADVNTSGPQTFTITVTVVDDPPVAVDDAVDGGGGCVRHDGHRAGQ